MLRDSIVGVETRYGQDGPGFKTRWGKNAFHSPHPTRRAPRPIPSRKQWVTGFFPGGKAAGPWRW